MSTKHILAVSAGAFAGTMLYIPITQMLGVQIQNGIGFDDLVIGAVFAATITASMYVFRSV